MSHPRIILGSQSVNRQHLIALAGIEAEIMPSDFDEYAVKPADFPDHDSYVSTIATGKLFTLADQLETTDNTYIVGGDLVVYLDDVPYHKPTSLSQAREYMQLFSGATHTEVCATAFWSPNTGVQTEVSTVLVTVPELTDKEIEDYLEIATPLTKAGGFSIQAVQKIVRRREPPATSTVEGSISALLGISLPAVEKFFTQAGLPVPRSTAKIESELAADIGVEVANT
ncbi:Maf family protein [Candidatus Woesebacteria bacterium]|nr:Maf family protein [Candidatus Woesebacteria bacterium]MCD8507085.1 Maf family protein [Candidatus Woesebacteria bacterium]MCD8546570.1 Maf family protein [Candidatus Woesebacteria bacterium]